MVGGYESQPGGSVPNASFSGLSTQGQVSGAKGFQAVSQFSLSLGPCFGCGGMGHLKKHCPVLLRAQSSTINN